MKISSISISNFIIINSNTKYKTLTRIRLQFIVFNIIKSHELLTSKDLSNTNIESYFYGRLNPQDWIINRAIPNWTPNIEKPLRDFVDISHFSSHEISKIPKNKLVVLGSIKFLLSRGFSRTIIEHSELYEIIIDEIMNIEKLDELSYRYKRMYSNEILNTYKNLYGKDVKI